jgi:hypothetical protein
MQNRFDRFQSSARKSFTGNLRGKVLCTALAAALLGGCGKNHKDDPYQGTWFAAQADGKDHGPLRAIEFKPKDKTTGDVVMTPMRDHEKPITGTYERVGDNQIKLMNPDQPNQPLVLTVTVDPAADTVSATSTEMGMDKLSFRWLKSDETLESAIKADEAAVEQMEKQERNGQGTTRP